MSPKDSKYGKHLFLIGKYKGKRISKNWNGSYQEYLYEMYKLDETTRPVIAIRIAELSLTSIMRT